METGAYANELRERIPYALSGPSFHGEDWYRCPHCGKCFEFFDAEYEHGFRKIQNGVYLHITCNKKLKIV